MSLNIAVSSPFLLRNVLYSKLHCTIKAKQDQNESLVPYDGNVYTTISLIHYN